MLSTKTFQRMAKDYCRPHGDCYEPTFFEREQKESIMTWKLKASRVRSLKETSAQRLGNTIPK